ncbi:MAG TPA: DUF881 domain-containing protein [Spirochaetia bacterium]|nr:DUF881 domain-containing protein [Spirochaetia bacterium]
MRLRGYHFAMGLAGIILGLTLGLQFRYATVGAAANPDSGAAQLVNSVEQMHQERDTLQNQVDALRKQLDALTNQPQLDSVKQALEVARVEAGVDAVTGPGVQITLNDSTVPFSPNQNPNLYVLHDSDVLRVLNEIKAAGGEAIAMNGHRLLGDSEIRCIGPAILINKTIRVTPPYVITAVGNPDTLAGSLNMRGGVVDFLRFWGIQVTVEKVNQVKVPAYDGNLSFDYAHPVN